MVICAGHADVAALLLEYDANKDCRTKTGITPLFQVCGVFCVSFLLLDVGIVAQTALMHGSFHLM